MESIFYTLRKLEPSVAQGIVYDALKNAMEGDALANRAIEPLLIHRNIGRLGAAEVLAKIGWAWSEYEDSMPEL
jgi:hypothetical protein